MDSYLDRKAEFTRDLVVRLGGCEPGDLAERTGLLEVTIRTLLAGDGELMSWEVVGACLIAAGVGRDSARQVRARWSAAEQMMWEERGNALKAAFEQDPHGKPAKIADVFRPKVPWRRLTSRFPVTLEPWAEPKAMDGRRLPDPATAGDIRALYGLLAELRLWAGSPRQSEIERRSWGALPDATLSAMLQKDRWRTANDRERRRIGHFAAACGLPEPEAARWVDAYERLRHIPPPDDLAQARAEEAELRRLLAEARAEVADLRRRVSDTEGGRPHAAARSGMAAQQPADRHAGPVGEPVAESEGAAVRVAEPEGEAVRVAESEGAAEGVAEPEGAAGRAAARGADAARGGWQRVRSQGNPRRRRVASAAAAVSVFAAGVLTGGLALGGALRRDQSVCFDGTLQLIGSTAFERMADELARGYEHLCQDADVEVSSEGSNEGVRTLRADRAASTIVMHDGQLRADSAEVRLWGFHAFPVALVTFAVVVHKDIGITDLSIRDLRAIYAADSGPVHWSGLRRGATAPIRLVSRTEGSGTRAIFEERVLEQPEPELSSGDCLRKDEIRAAARIIRCERSSQSQVLDLVNRVPGAIGYAELGVAADRRRYPDLRILAVDGIRADSVRAGSPYLFTAPEVFYTYGYPANGSPASAFLTYLTGEAARRRLQGQGFPSCVKPDAAIADRCRGA